MRWKFCPQFFMHISIAMSASICLSGALFFMILSFKALTQSLPCRAKLEFTKSHMSTFTPQSGSPFRCALVACAGSFRSGSSRAGRDGGRGSVIGECDREMIESASRDRRTRPVRVPPRTRRDWNLFLFVKPTPRVPPRRRRDSDLARDAFVRGETRDVGGECAADPGRSGSSASGYRPQSRETRVASASSYLLRQDVRGVPGLVRKETHPEHPPRRDTGRMRRHRGRGGRDRLAILGAAPAEPVVAPEGDGREGLGAGFPRPRCAAHSDQSEIPDLGDVGDVVFAPAT